MGVLETMREMANTGVRAVLAYTVFIPIALVEYFMADHPPANTPEFDNWFADFKETHTSKWRDMLADIEPF